MKKKIRIKIIKEILKAESNKKGKKYLLKELKSNNEKYLLSLLGNISLFRDYLIKNRFKIKIYQATWVNLKNVEFCLKDIPTKIDELDYMTKGLRTIGETYNYLKNNTIKNKTVDIWIKERLKYHNQKLPNFIIIFKTKKKKWIIDGNHRIFTLLNKKNKMKQFNYPKIYEFSKK